MRTTKVIPRLVAGERKLLEPVMGSISGQRLNVIRFLLALLACFVVTSCSDSGGDTPTQPTTPTGRTLSVPFVGQQTPVWCWAAASEMVFRYYGRGAFQCEVVSGWLQRDCCTFPVFCQAAAPSMQTIRQTLLAFGGIGSLYLPSPLAFVDVANEIDAGRPIIVGYQGSFIGHVVVIYGYQSDGTIEIHDPNYGSVSVPYSATFSYGGQLVWADTIFGIR